jgi:hypothetical protein
MQSTHSARLERWLGPAEVERVSIAMRGWYGPPIALAGVPGSVWATGDGDFVGRIEAGQVVHALDWLGMRTKRIFRNVLRRQQSTLYAGFASLSDLISEATTAGKQRFFAYQKSGPTGVVGSCHSLWRVGSSPPAGAAGSAAPGGRAPDDSTTGAFPFSNPTGGDTQHLVSATSVCTVVNTLLLYDRIFDVAKTIASTANESVTGVPTRYQSSTSTAADYAGGNFIFMEVGGTQLANTAHNWGVAGSSNECLYRNQAGTDNSIMPVLAGNPGGVATIVDRLDMPNGTWFAPLATGDTGAMDLAQMRCSASVATGALNFVIGHPIAILPIPIVGVGCVYDGINTAFNLTRIFDDACLAFLELNRAATTAATHTGLINTVAG